MISPLRKIIISLAKADEAPRNIKDDKTHIRVRDKERSRPVMAV